MPRSPAKDLNMARAWDETVCSSHHTAYSANPRHLILQGPLNALEAIYNTRLNPYCPKLPNLKPPGRNSWQKLLWVQGLCSLVKAVIPSVSQKKAPPASRSFDHQAQFEARAGGVRRSEARWAPAEPELADGPGAKCNESMRS